MDVLKLKQLAESHYDNLHEVVKALKAQGNEIKLTKTANCVFFTQVKPGEVINEPFYLDNEVSISRMAQFTRDLRNQLVVRPTQGSVFSKEANHG
jgi:hypothetical protein